MFMTPHPSRDDAEDTAIESGNPEEDAYAFLVARSPRRSRPGCSGPELKDADLVAQTVWAGIHGVVSLHIAKCNDDWVDWRPPIEDGRAARSTTLHAAA